MRITNNNRGRKAGELTVPENFSGTNTKAGVSIINPKAPNTKEISDATTSPFTVAASNPVPVEVSSNV